MSRCSTKISFDELLPGSSNNPLINGEVGLFHTEEELVARYGADAIARWKAEASEFRVAFDRWRAGLKSTEAKAKAC
jgi:hypothetical protein